MSRHAIIAHIFYEELGRELVDRLTRIDIDFDLFVTGQIDGPLRQHIIHAIPTVDFVPTRSAGFDAAPFLDALAVVSGRGYDTFCKVHTKRGDFAFGERWREACLGILGSTATVERVGAAFHDFPSLAIAGPAALYMSVAVNLLGNRDNVDAMFARCFPGVTRPADWGFFAGTMFWGRTKAFLPFLEIRKSTPFPAGLGQPDGHPEHALERLFGLAGLPMAGRVGLLSDRAGEPVLEIADEVPPEISVNHALARLGRPDGKGPPTAEEARSISRNNPLLHYLRSGRNLDNDPNALFSNRWYLAANPDVGADTTPLADYIGRKGLTPPPSPLFGPDLQGRSRTWQARLGINPLYDYLQGGAAALHEAAGAAEGAPGLAIAIKTPARLDAPTVWGDTAFAEGLASALERLGHRPTVQFRDEWYPAEEAADVVIAIRGPVRYEPRPGPFNILWTISHPDQVTIDEMESFDRVYVASESHAKLLATVLDVPVSPLLQATDATRIHPVRRNRSGVLFVGNSRGEDRKVVRWAIEEGLAPTIVGGGWEKYAPEELIAASSVDSDRLGELYGAAAAVLNDHWEAMKAFGYVSNRLLDTVAAGGVPVSDVFPAVRRLLGAAVVPVEARDEIRNAVKKARGRGWGSRLRAASAVIARHSFDVRAATIAEDIRKSRHRRRSATKTASKAAAIQVVVPSPGADWGHLTYARLVLPLTLDVAGDLDIAFATTPDITRTGFGRVLVMSSEALGDAASRALVRDARAAGTKVIMDYGSGYPSAVETAGSRRGRSAVQADEIWVPGELSRRADLRATAVRVIPDGIDQRIWRDLHARLSFADARQRLRVLVLADGDDPWIATFVDAVRKAAATRVEFNLVGSRLRQFGASGASVRLIETPRSRRSYPRFVEWLRKQNQFHLGIGGQGAESGRRCLAYAALGAVPILSELETGGAAMIERGLALDAGATAEGVIETVRRVADDPMPFEAMAAAARNFVWTERNAADAAALMLVSLASDQPT